MNDLAKLVHQVVVEGNVPDSAKVSAEERQALLDILAESGPNKDGDEPQGDWW
ncbi:MAG: hypothetical protein H5T69_17780 [Chloroflexi bacterium]|nr:hypothetical protein [Chloroflexota bacterium]